MPRCSHARAEPSAAPPPPRAPTQAPSIVIDSDDEVTEVPGPSQAMGGRGSQFTSGTATTVTAATGAGGTAATASQRKRPASFLQAGAQPQQKAGAPKASWGPAR